MHVIFYDGYLNQRGGGPPGYLWNLRNGLDRIGQLERVTFVTRQQLPTGAWIAFREKIKATVGKFPRLHRVIRTYIGGNVHHEWRSVLRFLKQRHVMGYDDPIFSSIDLNSTQSIHAHDTLQAIKIHNELVVRGCRERIKLILTSHTPELHALERVQVYRDAGIPEKIIQRIEPLHILADEQAFSIADTIIFPSRDAMEPYHQFDRILSRKDVRFVRTGIAPLEIQNTVDADYRARLKDKFVICYIGRHTQIKGYDILKEAGALLLDKHPDLAFVIVGRPGPLAALDHPRWIEVGWSPHPEQAILSSDVFALPNRSTFFDLVLLEVMSLGKPVIASRTGGNKTVAAGTPGVILYEGLGELISKIEQLKNAPLEQRKKLGEANEIEFRKHYTAEIFARNYLRMIDEIVAPQSKL